MSKHPWSHVCTRSQPSLAPQGRPGLGMAHLCQMSCRSCVGALPMWGCGSHLVHLNVVAKPEHTELEPDPPHATQPYLQHMGMPRWQEQAKGGIWESEATQGAGVGEGSDRDGAKASLRGSTDGKDSSKRRSLHKLWSPCNLARAWRSHRREHWSQTGPAGGSRACLQAE